MDSSLKRLNILFPLFNTLYIIFFKSSLNLSFKVSIWFKIKVCLNFSTLQEASSSAVAALLGRRTDITTMLIYQNFLHKHAVQCVQQP